MVTRPAGIPFRRSGIVGRGAELALVVTTDPAMRVHVMIGDEGFERLCRGFYARVPGDDILGPMYEQSVGDDLAEAERRLRLFLIQRCGGPTTYSQQRGHPRLRQRHAPFAIDERARDRWLRLMSESMAESGLPPEAEGPLEALFVQIADFMVNR